MVLPIDIQPQHQDDPLVVLPLPSPLPISPLPSLPALISHLETLIASSPNRHGPPATTLAVQMRQLTRDAYALLNVARVDAAESRADLDRRDTTLRGVEYERNRIREEIERCMEYV
jgi:THO complex subunit 5